MDAEGGGFSTMSQLEQSRDLQEALDCLMCLKWFTKSKISQMGLQAHVDEEDVHQEVLLSIASRQSSSPITNIRAYLRTCVLRQLFKIKKNKDRELHSDVPVELLVQEVQVPEEMDTDIKIRYLLTKISALDRKILECVFFEGLKAPQIAEKLKAEGHNISHDNVRARKKRALDRLRVLYSAD
jgi:RNA polymerase sigma factor (sigma-70 family)